jgi:hypothetical protein
LILLNNEKHKIQYFGTDLFRKTQGKIMEPSGDDSSGRIWRTTDAVHVDVRGLQPPGPMVAILRLIDSGTAGTVLIAHLDREPVFLYPELDDRGWRYETMSRDTDSGGVILRITREGDR